MRFLAAIFFVLLLAAPAAAVCEKQLVEGQIKLHCQADYETSGIIDAVFKEYYSVTDANFLSNELGTMDGLFVAKFSSSLSLPGMKRQALNYALNSNQKIEFSLSEENKKNVLENKMTYTQLIEALF